MPRRQSGGLRRDPYTDRDVTFASVQIDHVVSLKNAWDSGASSWAASKRGGEGVNP